jgi:hypothetical protein
MGIALTGSARAVNQWHTLKLLGAPAVGWLVDLPGQKWKR